MRKNFSWEQISLKYFCSFCSVCAAKKNNKKDDVKTRLLNVYLFILVIKGHEKY